MRAIALLLLLAGCVTTEDRMVAADRQCRSYGAQPGSQAYVQCRLQIDQNRANQRLVNSTSPVGMIVNAADR